MNESSQTVLKRIKNPFKDKEEKFITAVEQFYSTKERLPTGEELTELGAVGSSEEYLELLNNKYVQKVFETLGIKIDANIPILEPRQLAAIQVMFDFHDGRSDAKKLKDLGISGQTWQNWLRDPVFQRFCQNKAESLFTLNHHEIDKALFARARAGSTDAIRLYLQLTGKLREAAPAPKVGTQDSHYFLIRVFEAIQETLADYPELMKELAFKLKAISNPFMGEVATNKVINLDQPQLEGKIDNPIITNLTTIPILIEGE